jgi:hypothetical protein
MQLSSKADLERTEVERWKGEVVEDVMEESMEAVLCTVVVGRSFVSLSCQT